MEGVQQSLLEAEGVTIDRNGRIDLARFGWQPRLHSFLPRARERSRKGGKKGSKR